MEHIENMSEDDLDLMSHAFTSDFTDTEFDVEFKRIMTLCQKF